MNISLICGGYPVHNRPVNVFVEQLVDELVKQNHHVDVIAPQSITRYIVHHEKLLPKRTERNIDGKSYVVYRPYFLSLGRCPNCVQNKLERTRMRAIKKVLKNLPSQPDVLYGHFWNYGYLVKDYAKLNNIPIVVACGEGDGAIDELLQRITVKDKLQFVKQVKAVISVSSENKRICLEKGLSREENTIVLPNAINPNLFRNLPNRQDLRGKLGIEDEDFVISFVGSFIYRKGSRRLAEAIERIGNPHIKVLFIGKIQSGDDSTPSCPGIIFMGSLNHNEIPAYLNSSDVFCLPTLKEGCCNAIVEALAAGKPVISSDRPFNYDILDDTNSILVDPMDIDAIANAIKCLYNDRALCRKLSDGAIEKAKALTITKRAELIADFIELKIHQ